MVNSDRIISEKAEKVLFISFVPIFVCSFNIPENTESVSLEGTETSSSRKVASLHDPTRNKDPTWLAIYSCVGFGSLLWVRLVNTSQTGRSLQVRVDDHDLALVLLLAGLVQDCRDGITELDSACSTLLGASDEQLGVFGRFDSSEDIGAFGVSLVEVGNCGLTTGQLASCHHWDRERDLHLDGIVGVVGSFETLDTDSHLSLSDNGGRSVVVDGIAHGGV
jgi:hypothetical protein